MIDSREIIGGRTILRYSFPTNIWFEKDFENYRISYVLLVDFANPEIILAGECMSDVVM